VEAGLVTLQFLHEWFSEPEYAAIRERCITGIVALGSLLRGAKPATAASALLKILPRLSVEAGVGIAETLEALKSLQLPEMDKDRLRYRFAQSVVVKSGGTEV